MRRMSISDVGISFSGKRASPKKSPFPIGPLSFTEMSKYVSRRKLLPFLLKTLKVETFSKHILRIKVVYGLQVKSFIKERKQCSPLGSCPKFGRPKKLAFRNEPQGDIWIDLTGVGGRMEMDAGLVQIRPQRLEF